MNIDEVTAKYVTDFQPLYRLYATKVQELIDSILKANHITPHSVTSREKAPSNLREKITREGKSYEDPLHQITDLAGVRIITYFPTDVDLILPILEAEFLVDWNNSIDKRKTADPSTFGYASVHLVVEHTPERCKFPEYAIFKSLKCEIQVRTILQHAWAEIEHDIVYKANDEIPFELRRKFASLAGLLEVADREFEMLRKEEAKIREEIKHTITQDNLDIPINLDSLTFYLEKYHKDTFGKEKSLGLLIKLLADKNVQSLNQLHSYLTPVALEAADREISQAMPCPDPKPCLLRYFIAISHRLKISKREIADYAGCDILYVGRKGPDDDGLIHISGKHSKRPKHTSAS